MKKTLLLLASIFTFMGAKADEGMWIPALINKNYEEMQRLGLKLTQQDLYDINHASMKDAILQFGGGCTAEMVSPNGLLITNHHCGYDAIAGLSTVERNLLDNGFWAHKMDEELPAPGVTALFLQSMIDITQEVLTEVGSAKGEEYTKKFEEVKKKIEARENNGGKLVANVKDYFNGNQFFLLIYKRYTDVRLVGNPPRCLGKFGGDVDNWMWPRHTADFSMFRIYADENNEPRPYNVKNTPYHPKKYLPISIKGVEEGDYAMIFGYPGRTNRYETSYGVDLSINVTNPAIVAIRTLRLDIMKRHMDQDKSVYLKLTSMYSSVANYWKYYIGQTEQLKRLNVIDDKRKNEKAFTAWESTASLPADLMDSFAAIYKNYGPYAKHAVYYGECFRASALTKMAAIMKPLYTYYEKNEKPNADSIKAIVAKIKAERRGIAKTFDLGTEKELFAAMTKMYHDSVEKSQLPDIYASVILSKKYMDAKDKSGSMAAYEKFTEDVFAHTFLIDSNAFNKFCDNPSFAALKNDAAVNYAMSFMNNYSKNYQSKIEGFATKKAEYAREYLKQYRFWRSDKMLSPDANSTMRITYGKVKGYNPQDGLHANFYTTIDGLIAKYKPGNDDFEVPKEVIELYNKKDFGQYADADGTLHTCFVTTNDITGGNSGSPCINGDGEWIGTAFDGNWEAMSGDIAFDKKYKRTIVCDARYVLFLIDKLGHADNIIKEMDIRK